jgi:LysR family transcriptional regulator (chromosome initiation inhibitor)
MDLPSSQLSTLLAIAEHGTFEAAARALRLTPSAVSQRVRALEATVGQVVVQRSAPCRPTAAGEVLLRLARQHQLLAAETQEALGAGGGTELAVAVNADSLATWFRPVLGEVAGWEGVSFRLAVEDQAFSADLLRRGEVLAAVTSDPTPVQGCRTTTLGAMRYRPAASPAVAERWRHGRGTDWARMPVVVLNEKDDLQHRELARRGVVEPTVRHRVPSSDDFLAAVRLGLGWGMLPEQQLAPGLADGSLVRLGRTSVDVPLHWVRWRLASPTLDRLGRRGGAGGLRAAARGPQLTGRSALVPLLDVGGRPGALVVHHEGEHDREDADDRADPAEGRDLDDVGDGVGELLDHAEQEDQADDEQQDANTDSHGDSSLSGRDLHAG